MSNRTCPSCGKEVATQTKICPWCGYAISLPLSKKKNPGCLIFILSLIAISVGIVLAIKNYSFSILSLGFIGIIIGSHYIKKGITPEEAHRRQLLKEKKAVGIVSGDIPRKDQIKYTKIVAQVSEKSTGSVVTRGAIGLAIAGQVGVTAALTAKNKETTTFLIVETDGQKHTVVTQTNSNIFHILCQYLKE